jgi:hypothetical protein
MAVVTPTAKAQFIDAAGVPLAGGFLYTYAAGTTTPQATYTDSTAATANSNPIVLDARGEANIWLSSADYKFKLTDADGTEIWTVDNIAAPSTALSPVFSSNVTISANTSGPALLVTQTGAGAAIRVQDSADPDASPFVVDTTGQVGIGTAAPANALDVAGGAIQISTSGGTARTVISADSTDSIFSVNDDRNFTVKTNTAARLTVNSTGATFTVPVIMSGGGATITGNTSVTGTLNVSGLTTLASNLSIVNSTTEMAITVGSSGGYFYGNASQIGWKNSGGTAKVYWDTSGNFTAAANVTAYSDAKLKKNVETIPNALALVEKMRGVFYDRVDTGEAGVGVIAQELQAVLPQLVKDNDGTLSVAYGNLVGVLIEAVKELSAKLESR